MERYSFSHHKKFDPLSKRAKGRIRFGLSLEMEIIMVLICCQVFLYSILLKLITI